MFAPVEWMIAGRYMRARRQEGFISVIAGFSLLGRILGLNGHFSVVSQTGEMTDYQPLSDALRKLPDVVTVTPLGSTLCSSNPETRRIRISIRTGTSRARASYPATISRAFQCAHW